MITRKRTEKDREPANAAGTAAPAAEEAQETLPVNENGGAGTPESAGEAEAETAENGIALLLRRIADGAIAEIAGRADGLRAELKAKTEALAPRPEEAADASERSVGADTVRVIPADGEIGEGEYRPAEQSRENDAQRNKSGAQRGERRNRLSSAEKAVRREAKMQLLQRLADAAAAELPKEFYDKLNGGIALTDRTKTHPGSDPAHPLLVLGEYRNDRNLGRSIMLYGGSILRTYGGLDEERLGAEMRRIIRHEFTHHLESLAGLRDLEYEDRLRLEEYRAEYAEEAEREARKKKRRHRRGGRGRNGAKRDENAPQEPEKR